MNHTPFLAIICVQAILVPPKTVTTFELHKLEDDQWYLWVAVQDGTIYRNCIHLTNHVSRYDNEQKSVKMCCLFM